MNNAKRCTTGCRFFKGLPESLMPDVVNEIVDSMLTGVSTEYMGTHFACEPLFPNEKMEIWGADWCMNAAE